MQIQLKSEFGFFDCIQSSVIFFSLNKLIAKNLPKNNLPIQRNYNLLRNFFLLVFISAKRTNFDALKMPSTPFNSPPPSQHSSESMYRSPQMRKEALRNVYVNAKDLQNNVNTRTIENLEQIVNEVDTINQEGSLEDKIKDQGEVLLDSEIMTISSNVLKKCTLSLADDISCYNCNDFAAKIRSYACSLPDTIEGEPNWSLLGSQIIRCFKTTAQFTIVLGALQPIPKKEITKRKIVKEAQAPVKRPENVIALDKEEDSVEQTVEEIRKIIYKYQKLHKTPLDLFSLVLDPRDFGKTVENILHVSFLIRDGLVTFTADEDGIPYVEKTSKEVSAEQTANKKKRNIQNVLTLNMEQWKNLVQVYKIKKPMIDLNIINTGRK